jgi:peptidyl-prolyl cis-trans isomerase SurA
MPIPEESGPKAGADSKAKEAEEAKPEVGSNPAAAVIPSVSAPELSERGPQSSDTVPAQATAGPNLAPEVSDEKAATASPKSDAENRSEAPEPRTEKSSEASSDGMSNEDVPIVGTAIDENGEEFGLPKLPDEMSAPGQATPSGSDGPKAAPAQPAPGLDAPGELPPLEQSTPTSATQSVDSFAGTSIANRPPIVDPAVRQASTSPAEMKSPEITRNVKEAGRAAAGVGDEVITLNDLVSAVREYRKKHPSQRPPNKDELNQMGKGILLMLIERSLLTQEAKRTLKNPKMLDHLMSYAEEAWNKEELPPLLRKYYATNAYELKEKMTADNRSLDAIHESFRQDFLAQAFLQQKIGGRLKVELPEMLKYYQEHVNDPENQRPATITWREILVETKKYPSPQAAREKAERLADRIRKGEAFATLAKTESDGPSLTKSAGGLMETTPGSYGVASVNHAIESLPVGKLSEILEGPNSLHLVVVEKRRAAGPITFEESQDQIRRVLQDQKVQKERVALLEKLRKQTVVWTIFDNTESDPFR